MGSRHGFTLIDTLITIVIIGILAAVVVPRYTVASISARESNLAAQLFTIRSQIEAHNAKHPAEPFEPLARGWEQLILKDYLDAPPQNPMQNGLSNVMPFPTMGNAWVWADPTGVGRNNIYATDETGGYLDVDGDGRPD